VPALPARCRHERARAEEGYALTSWGELGYREKRARPRLLAALPIVLQGTSVGWVRLTGVLGAARLLIARRSLT